MSDLLRIAVSGLLANQSSLNTTGHNIASAGVEGYSRQRVELGTRPSQFLSGNFFGNGVDIIGVSRAVDEFTTRQLRTDTWVYNAAETLRAYSEQIDGILTDPSIGVSSRIDSFFNAVQAGGSDPASIPTRQVVLGEATTLAQRFNAIYQRLEDLNSALDTQLKSAAADISALAQEIADLNRQITASGAASGQGQPNDLLDQRDQTLLRLSELVDITSVRDGASISVFLGKGQGLVVGTEANTVVATPGLYDPARTDLAVIVAGSTRPVAGTITGGKVGGLLDFRDRVLDQAFNQLGRVALGIAEDVNQQQQLGMDLDGDLGGVVFRDANSGLAPVLRARAARDNDPASTGVVTVNIDDTSQLTASAYQLDILAGGAWRLFRRSDDTVVASGAALTDPLASVDGFTLELNLPLGSFVEGDSFLIEPTRRAAGDISVVMTRAQDLAFAQPVRAEQSGTNLGNARAGVTQVFDTSTALFATTPGQLAPPLLIRFTSATTYEVLDNSIPSNPIALAPPLASLNYTPGVSNDLFSTTVGDPDYFGFQVRVSGNPQAGDSFALNFNTGGVSDNRNALALASLQTADTLANGTASYQTTYGQLVGYVGSETRGARISAQAGAALVEQTRAQKESQSGVNLDEEAADLIRFEQAYNAMAQVIAVARNVIDSLLKATG